MVFVLVQGQDIKPEFQHPDSIGSLHAFGIPKKMGTGAYSPDALRRGLCIISKWKTGPRSTRDVLLSLQTLLGWRVHPCCSINDLTTYEASTLTWQPLPKARKQPGPIPTRILRHEGGRQCFQGSPPLTQETHDSTGQRIENGIVSF